MTGILLSDTAPTAVAPPDAGPATGGTATRPPVSETGPGGSFQESLQAELAKGADVKTQPAAGRASVSDSEAGQEPAAAAGTVSAGHAGTGKASGGNASARPGRNEERDASDPREGDRNASAAGWAAGTPDTALQAPVAVVQVPASPVAAAMPAGGITGTGPDSAAAVLGGETLTELPVTARVTGRVTPAGAHTIATRGAATNRTGSNPVSQPGADTSGVVDAAGASGHGAALEGRGPAVPDGARTSTGGHATSAAVLPGMTPEGAPKASAKAAGAAHGGRGGDGRVAYAATDGAAGQAAAGAARAATAGTGDGGGSPTAGGPVAESETHRRAGEHEGRTIYARAETTPTGPTGAPAQVAVTAAGFSPAHDSWSGPLTAGYGDPARVRAEGAGHTGAGDPLVADIYRQVAARSIVSGGPDQQVMQVTVNPRHLGEVSLRLILSGTDVSAHLQVPIPAWQHDLAARHGELAEFFARQGLTLGQLSVGLGYGQGGEAGFPGKDGPRAAVSSRIEAATAVSSVPRAGPLQVVAAGRLDCLC